MKLNKVYFVVSNLGIGGTQRITITLAEWLKAYGVVTKLIAIGRFANQYELPDKIDFCCLEHISNTRIVQTVAKLHHMLMVERPDLVITMGVPSCIFSVPAMIGLKVKHIISERNDPRHFLGKPIVAKISRMFMKFANGFVFQTDEARAFYCFAIQRRSAVIPNPIIAKNVPDATECIKTRKIVTMGRLVEQKNHRLLIEAFDAFSKQCPGYELHIFGSGGLHDQLETYITGKQQSDGKVFLHEACNDVLERIADADMFVLSSDFEGMPNALMEAMAMGLPCISTDCPCGGPKYLIQDGINGFLVPVRDRDKMVEKMIMVARDEALKHKVANEAMKIRDELSTDAICTRWYAYCESVLNNEVN